MLTEVSVTSVRTDEGGARISLSNGNTVEAALVVSADSRLSEIRRHRQEIDGSRRMIEKRYFVFP